MYLFIVVECSTIVFVDIYSDYFVGELFWGDVFC